MLRWSKSDQSSDSSDLVENIRLGVGDSRLSNKIFQLISEVRGEVAKKYKLDKPVSDMHWDEKVNQLPSEAWMMEQVLSMLEKFVERQTGKSNREGKRSNRLPGRHGG